MPNFDYLKFIRIAGFFSLTSVLLSPLNLHATERESLLFMEIPLVVTATKTTQKIEDVPATVVVISKKQIRERGYNNLLDLMKYLPGVDVQDRGGQETYNLVLVRGIPHQEKFIIMMDGHRVSSPTGESIPIAENFPLYNAKQVEIVYGPASALYGADAFAGVINIITRDAKDLGGWEASVSAGSFGYQNHYLNYGDRLSKNITLSAGGHWHEADNADLRKYYNEYQLEDLVDQNTSALLQSAEDRNFDVPTESHSAYLKLDINDAFTLGYSRSYFRHPSGQGDLPQQTYFDEDVKWETLINNYYADYRFDDEDSLSGKTSVSYLTYEVLNGSNFEDQWDNYEKAYKYARSHRFKLEQQLNLNINEDNILTGGVSYEDFYSLPKTTNLTHPFDKDKSVAEQGYFYAGTNSSLPLKIYELNYTNIGAYLQLQSDCTSTLSSTFGVRFDDNSRYGSTVNPRGGIVYQPRSTTAIKLLYGEAYQAPSPYRAYSNYGTFDGVTDGDGDYTGDWFRLPNPDLEPEELKTWELGIIEDATEDLKLEAAFFYTEAKNLITGGNWEGPTIIGSSLPYDTSIPGSKINSYKRAENAGEATWWGGELSVDYSQSVSGARLNYWANYSYLKGSLTAADGTKTEHPLIAKHKAKAGITAVISNYYVSPSLRWVGQSNNSRITTPGNSNQRVKSYIVTDLNVGANNLRGNLSASINIQNLFDKRYYNAGANSARHPSVPQEPRRIVLSLNYKL